MRRILHVSILGATLAAFAPQAARAAEPTAPEGAAGEREAWSARFDAARAKMIDGKYREAQRELLVLAEEAPRDMDRVLALEMARLAGEYAARAESLPTTVVKAPPPRVRGTDEMTLLYASSFLYGIGTGVWFLLEVQPDSAATATVPFAAITAAPVIAVATVDGYKKFPPGVPHAISAGLYLGLGEGIWIVGAQHARAERARSEDPASDSAWKPQTVAGVLWGGATAGAAVGGALGYSLVTTPGRVSFTASTTIWSGVLSGLAAGAIAPEDDRHRERSYVAGGVGYNLGLAGGLLFAGEVSPSVARVRLADLLGAAGALASAGTYLSLAGSADLRVAEGIAAGGGAIGLAAGWILTRGMKKELPSENASAAPIAAQPTFAFTPGGGTIGVAGSL
jgi:hypothetical protein